MKAEWTIAAISIISVTDLLVFSDIIGTVLKLK
jgi:hypothetical protein